MKRRLATLVGLWSLLPPAAAVAQWELLQGPSLPRIQALSVHPLRPDELLVLGQTGLFLTTSGGLTYQQVFEGTGGGLFFRHPDDPDRVLVGSLVSTDAGKSWSGLNRSFQVFASAPTRPDWVFGLASGRDEQHSFVEVWVSSDRGRSFRQRASFAHNVHQVQPAAVTIDPADPDLIFVAVGENLGDRWTGHLYASTNGGSSWERRPGPEGALASVTCDPVRPSQLYALTSLGAYRSANAGASWERLLGFSGSVNVWPGDRDEIVVSRDGNGPIWIKSANRLWTSANGGSSWNQAHAPWSRVVPNSSLSSLGGGRAYASSGELLFFTENWGQSWRQLGSPPMPARLSYVAVSPVDSSRVYAAECCHGPTFRSTDGGRSWGIVSDSGVNGLVLHPDDPAHVYALGGGSAGLRESLDQGASWRELGNWRTQTGTAGSNHVSAFSFSPDTPRTLYIGAGGYDYFDGSEPSSWGRVFVSRDAGATWSRTSFGHPNWAILGVAGRRGDPNTLVVATSNAGIFRTTDGGGSWQQVSGDSAGGGRHFLSGRMQADPLNPDLIVASTATLLVSEDFGTTWRARAPESGAPPSVLITHPADGGTRLIAPSRGSDGILYFSDDLGRSWSRVNTGLGDQIRMVAVARDGTVYLATQKRGVARGRLP